MDKLRATSQAFVWEDSGQDMVEYALVAGVIALGCIAGVGTLANQISNFFTSLPGHFYSAIFS